VPSDNAKKSPDTDAKKAGAKPFGPQSLGRGGKIIGRGGADVWVETLAENPYGLAPDAVSFHAAEITRLRAIGDAHTLIMLGKDEEYIVALPHAQLAARIYAAEGPVIDLKPHAYTGGKDALGRALKDAFDKAALREEREAMEGMTYRAFVRSSMRDNFTEAMFRGRDIDFDSLGEGGSKMGGKRLTFKTRLGDGSPFGTDEFLIETTLDSFRHMVLAAAREGKDTLDMREYSRRKGTVFPENRR